MTENNKAKKDKLFDDVNKNDVKDMSDLLQKDGNEDDFLNGYGKEELKSTEEDIFAEDDETANETIPEIDEEPNSSKKEETIPLEQAAKSSMDIPDADTREEEPSPSRIEEMRRKMTEITAQASSQREVSITQNNNNLNIQEGNTMKKFKILVTNSKGGVGKSTTTMQLIAPFLFLKNNNQPVPVYEFDSSVKDSNTFSSSKIAQPQIISVDNKSISFKLIDLLAKDEMMALDIGNSTSAAVLDSLASSGMIYAIDLFVLPLTDGEKDAEHALILYKKIKQNNPEAKFVFVLNRVYDNRTDEDSSNILDLQFIEFFGDTQNRFDSREGLIEQINPEDRNIIKLYETECIKHSRLLSKTIFEIAHINSSKLEEAQKASLLVKDFKQLNQLAVKSTIYQKARTYYSEVIKVGVDEIENIIK